VTEAEPSGTRFRALAALGAVSTLTVLLLLAAV
jgi:hypothetical protein